MGTRTKSKKLIIMSRAWSPPPAHGFGLSVSYTRVHVASSAPHLISHAHVHAFPVSKLSFLPAHATVVVVCAAAAGDISRVESRLKKGKENNQRHPVIVYTAL